MKVKDLKKIELVADSLAVFAKIAYTDPDSKDMVEVNMRDCFDILESLMID